MLGKRLNRLRKERHFTAQNMADMLCVTLRNYQKYESGDATPTVDRLIKMADVLHVSTDYLLCRDEFLAEQEEARKHE